MPTGGGLAGGQAATCAPEITAKSREP